MDATFHALGQILLNGLPTFFLILFLNFYLKQMFFKPLEQTLAKRYELTEGARLAADESLKNADQRIADYQAKLNAARSEVYAEQELAHRKLGGEQAAELEAAHKHAEEMLNRTKLQLASQKEAALETLAGRSDDLADRIAQSILKGKAA